MIKEYQPSANLFDEQYPSISTTAIYKPIYVGNGDFTLSTTIQKENDVALLFLLAGNVSTGIGTNTNGVWEGQIRTVTAVDGYVTIAYRKYNTSPENYQTMLNSGSSALPYEPYGNIWNTKSYCKATTGSETYSNFPIVVRSQEQSIPSWNMKGNEKHTGTASPTSPIEINGTGDRTENLTPNQKITSNTYSYTITTHPLINALKNITPNENYTLSWEFSSNGSGGVSNQIRLYTSASGTLIKILQQGVSFTLTSEEIANIGALFCYFGIGNTDGYMDKLMLVEGSTAPSTYIPYGYKIPISANGTALTPVYLTEQLMKINDYSDSLASSGAVTKNIKKVVFTGQETTSSIAPSSNIFAIRGIFNSQPEILQVGGLCTHYKYNNAISSLTTNMQDGDFVLNKIVDDYSFTIRDAAMSSAEDFKTFLQQQYAAGTPVTVWYVLETAETESVTAPTIPTTSSTTTIDVNASVKPSEMSLTYDGYKICKKQKYQNNAWT